ncbi:MAG: phosphate transport system regulatory protein PhoU [Bacteroidota bacterium]|nr:phosphate transport system regulatory protein PhoU [Bacteroidota bacterium]
MSNLLPALTQLRENLTTMMEMVKSMFSSAYTAVKTNDLTIVEDIIHKENRVNALELLIDAECENIIALYNPVAVDLRFVLSVSRINYNLERMGDLSVSIAKYIKQLKESFDPELMKQARTDEMFQTCLSMLENAIDAFSNQDTAVARKIFYQDELVDEINILSNTLIAEHSQKNPEKIRTNLFLFSIIKKLERFGDMSENIAEEIIFHIEAQVLKHTKPAKQKP